MASDTSLKVVLTAIGGNSLVTLAKFTGWFFTASPSMLAEGIHSAADTANQILILVGIKQSQKKADNFFPWGHGRARYVWNLISAMGIFFIGFGVTTYHGVHSLLSPGHAEGSSSLTISLVILLFSLLIEGYALFVAWKETKRQMGSMKLRDFLDTSDDPTTLGVLFEDSVAVLGVFIALTCIVLSHVFHLTWADAVGSILIGFLMGVMAIYLAMLNGKFLIGSSSTQDRIKDYRLFVESSPMVDKVVSIKSVVMGVGTVVLHIEMVFNEETLVDKELITQAISDIKRGENPGPILVKHTSRMVRVVGAKIVELEAQLKEKYPEVLAVNLEVH